jgi:hypothetical protein
MQSKVEISLSRRSRYLNVRVLSAPTLIAIALLASGCAGAEQTKELTFANTTEEKNVVFGGKESTFEIKAQSITAGGGFEITKSCAGTTFTAGKTAGTCVAKVKATGSGSHAKLSTEYKLPGKAAKFEETYLHS